VTPRRGDVYVVSIDPTVGAENRKTRPALVIQSDVANRRSPIIIVAAIISQFDLPLYPTAVPIDVPQGGSHGSVGCPAQDPVHRYPRLARRLGRLRTETMERVDGALAISLGLGDL
jgi:mRNA interferase MazF